MSFPAILNSLVPAGDNSYMTVGWQNTYIYTQIEVYKNEDGGSWGSAKSWGDGSGPITREAWDDNNVSTNVDYGYKVRGYNADYGGWLTFSNILYCQMFDDSTGDTIELDEAVADGTITGDITTDTIELSEVTSEAATISDSVADTLVLLDSVGDIYTLVLDTEYGYYFGDFRGKIYYEHEDYGSDDGTAINAYWLSKETDFSEFNKDALDKYKTVYGARLSYVDKTAGQSVIVSVSNDGGATWLPDGKNMGTGDGTTKSVDFFFVKTGNVFQFKIEHNATEGKFQWINLTGHYSIGGDYFEVG